MNDLSLPVGLAVELGHASRAGPNKPDNEDFFGAVTPEGDALAVKGMLFGVADGVSGHGGGREAAESVLHSVLSDYYATPDSWEIPHALDRVIAAANRWLLSQSARHREHAGMACTLSLLILRGTRYFVAHVGDSRVYRLRGSAFERLTVDHVWERPDMRHVLKRAVGLDQHLVVDYSEGELQAGDVFLLATDGVWSSLKDTELRARLEAALEAPDRASDLAPGRVPDHLGESAGALVAAAHGRGGQDDATALVVRVAAVGREDLRDVLDLGQELPPPPRLKPGQSLDGFEVLDVLHASRATLLYKARDATSGRVCVLKTLQPAAAADPAQREGLLAEEWLGRRVLAHYFPQVLALPAGRRTRLYYAMSHHEGETLEDRLKRGHHFTVAEVVQVGIRAAKGLGALHRLNVLHRDIKPANLHWGEDDKLRILDLGIALNPGLQAAQDGVPGTPSFLAPPLFAGAPPSPYTDLYALGATLYHLLTRKYPYGEVEPFQHPRFGDPTAPTRHRPDVPRWLENALLKACAREARHGFETAEEFLLALERGAAAPVTPYRTPLAERDPQRFWQAVAGFSLVANLLLVYVLLVG